MKYNVSVRAVYYDDLEIEADDVDDAHRKAIEQFVPCGDNMLSVDVYGLSPWLLGDDSDPNAADRYKDEQMGYD